MNCKTCKFYLDGGFRLTAGGNGSEDITKTVPAGSCRRYAPSSRANNWRSWPTVLATDFCHDFQVAPIPEPVPIPVVEKPSVWGKKKKA